MNDPGASASILREAELTLVAARRRPWKPELLRRWTVRVVSIAVCVLLWQFCASHKVDLGVVNWRNIPTPGEVLDAAAAFARSHKFLFHVRSSLFRVAAGLSAATAVGVPLGLAMGRSKLVSDVASGPLELLRPIPAVAWVPLAILMFPSSELSMIFITYVGALFPIVLNTIHGVESLDGRLIDASRSLGARDVARGLEVGLVLPGDRRDDRRPVRHRVLHLGVVQPADLPEHRRRHGVHRALRSAQQRRGQAPRGNADALAARGIQSVVTRVGRVEVLGVSAHLGAGAARTHAISDVDLTIEAGEFVCLLGPSGCGKSTLLAAIAGFVQPSRGRIVVDGQEVTRPDVERGIVFQRHTLLPWKTVLENVAFGLKMRGVDRERRTAEARKMLGLVRLAGVEDRYPAELSGGMQHRVEIARALLHAPRVVLMDEPFSALDAQTRLSMHELLLEIWQRMAITIVFVTHDIDEAVLLGDRVVVMSARPGEIRHIHSIPFERPRDPDLMTTRAFADIKRDCLNRIRSEVQRATAFRGSAHAERA
jgi:NitT/TauT family transport system ATP-binding protein